MRTLDDIYREVLWRTNLTTTDLPYIYSAGGNYSFLQLFGDVYKYLVNQAIMTDSDYFMVRSTDNLVADQEVYYLPSDLIRLRHIEFSFDGAYFYPGTITDPAFFKRGSEQATVSAAVWNHPYVWLGDTITGTISGSPYHVAPRPTTAQTSGILLYYDAIPSALFSQPISAAVSTASAKVSFPGQFEYLVPLGISVEVWGKYGSQEDKVTEIQRYQKGIDDMKNLTKPRANVGQKRVRDFREINVRDI